MTTTTKQTLNRIGLSAIIIAIWSSIAMFISANTPSPVISPIFFWILVSLLVVDCGAIICLVLRFINKIDRKSSFLYTMFGTSNFVFGLCGLTFYCLNKINLVGLQYLLLNLFLGILVLADIFFFDYLFEKT